jgi:hypothetical protein
MLAALRRTRLASLLALFIMAGSVPISTAALLHDAADDICQPTLILHDESAHRMGGARTTAPEPPQHCAICHWLQLLQTVGAAAGIVAPATQSHQLAVSVLAAACDAALGHLSARAPPLAI